MMSNAMPSEEGRKFQAIVLAGGKGVRLAPYSATLPKPLMPLGETPILEVVLRWLRAGGITDVAVAVSHLGHLIEAYFGDGSKFGMRLSYSIEATPLGTAGSIASLLDRMDDHFIIANGDVLTDLDLAGLLDAHRASGADATVGLHAREWKIDYGLVEIDRDMRLVDYREKPLQKHLVSMGVYAMKRASIAPLLEPGAVLDMPDLLLRMRDAGRLVRGHLTDCYWVDIGRPEDFAQAQRDYDSGRLSSLVRE
jgi:NDP-sugar pyrophosphorylase family protein